MVIILQVKKQQYLAAHITCNRATNQNQDLLCGSRKYPYPPMDGQWKFLGGGGLKGRNFQGVWGVGHVKNFQEA